MHCPVHANNVGFSQMTSQDFFLPISLSTIMYILCTCAASKVAASHSGYQTLEIGLVSLRSYIEHFI
jgi:hypothetical protein